MGEKSKTVTQQIEEICDEICDKYCKYPYEPIPEGKDEDWLTEDPESPCQRCPLNRLSTDKSASQTIRTPSHMTAVDEQGKRQSGWMQRGATTVSIGILTLWMTNRRTDGA